MNKLLFGRSSFLLPIILMGFLFGSCTTPLPNSDQGEVSTATDSEEVDEVNADVSESNEEPTEAGTEPSPGQDEGQSPNAADDFDPFRIAVETATEATELNKTAASGEEWRVVAEKWRQAIELMKAVPKNHEKYDAAQERALDTYPTNLAYAQGKAGEDALPEFTTDDDKMTKVDFGEGWPFVVDGELICERISAGEYVVDLVTLQSLGQVYAVNLSAQSRAQDRNWRNIDEIWRDSPIGEGKVPINWVIWRGEALCDTPLENQADLETST
ncbi:MAG: hypothetical protein VKJ64_10285 [Leptolyngbyaceae bacterium]|nr:hypothetical protein [Leptolyngbyaceae bacterium]